MEKQRRSYISCHGLKVNGDMLTGKNSKADDFETNAPRGNFVRNAFQNVSKSEKVSEHETRDYHKKVLEKAKNFVMAFEDPTKAMTHGKHENGKYQKNLHILKLTTEALLLCSEQGIT